MDKKTRQELAEKRLCRLLKKHGIATARTIEQKISDAGPFDQRIDPHIITPVRTHLEKAGQIKSLKKEGAPWYYHSETPKEFRDQRLADQLPIFIALHRTDVGTRLGQTLEIAIFRALKTQQKLEFLGNFRDLDEHDDSTLYSKEEPPQSISGKSLSGKQQLDFWVRHPQVGWAAIEAKNVREWLYPNREEIHELLTKCVALDCVPILIGRRIPFVTFKVLSICGVIFHQTYTQLLPKTEHQLAEKAKDKTLLGYHDIRTGNIPDSRLQKFIHTNLPNVLPKARLNFDKYKDLIAAYTKGMAYKEFAARVRRRAEGTPEDSDWEHEGENHEDDSYLDEFNEDN